MEQLLVRMAMWIRRRPSKAFVYAAIAVAVLAVVLVAIERTVGWPEALTADRLPRHHGPVVPVTPAE